MSTTLSKIWLSVGPFFHSFDHNSLVSRPFLAHKVPNRSSHHVLQNGQGVVSSFQLSVWSTVRSNLGQTLVNPGQTWSTLIKLGQTSPNSGKCIPDRVSRVFGHSGPPSGQKRLGQPLVKLGVITPFLPPGFSRVLARKTRQPEPSWPDPTRARHIK